MLLTCNVSLNVYAAYRAVHIFCWIIYLKSGKSLQQSLLDGDMNLKPQLKPRPQTITFRFWKLSHFLFPFHLTAVVSLICRMLSKVSSTMHSCSVTSKPNPESFIRRVHNVSLSFKYIRQTTKGENNRDYCNGEIPMIMFCTGKKKQTKPNIIKILTKHLLKMFKICCSVVFLHSQLFC